MQYQVLARKWRPQNFSELVGQPHVSRTLLNALKSGRIAHAFLFSGPRGSGKTTTARILAKALNCHEGKPGEPCGHCAACVEIAAGNCMDVLEIDAASHGLVDDIRDLMENVRYHPARDKRKIYIIDEAHMISAAGFNALLKTLEEPPPHVVFIMATTEYHKMPATILSRCQQYSFKLIPYDLILERLTYIARAEDFQISKAALEQIVFSSGGSMRDAMSALDQVVAFSGQTVKDEDVMMLLDLVEPAVLGETARAIAKNDTESILGVVAGQVESDRDLQNFCRRLLAHFRNLMVIKTGVASPSFLGVPESLLPDLKEQAGLFSPEDLLRLFDALVRVEEDLKHATQTRFQLEMGLLELAQISHLRSLEDLIADFNRMVRGEGGPSEKAPVVPPGAAGAGRFSKTEFAGKSAGYEKPGYGAAPGRPPSEGPGDAAEPCQPGGPITRREQVAPAEPGDDPRRLLLEIAAAAQKESLEPILQSLGGAKLQGDSVILDLGGANDFTRRQLQDNLEVIARAAANVVGFTVKIVMDTGTAEKEPARLTVAQTPPPADSPEDILERAKKEPVVRAFLEVFPGPVKAAKNNV